MSKRIGQLLILGVLLEIIIVFYSHIISENTPELFKYAARYSGRLSLLVFLIAFYFYAFSKELQLSNFIKLFAVVHLIHFGLLATNVYLNEIPLEAHKLIGGALAYLMIVLAPFKLDKLSTKWQLVYFYYVSFVMAMTYIARIKGDFEGAEPFWFHYAALITVILCCIGFGLQLYKRKKTQID